MQEDKQADPLKVPAATPQRPSNLPHCESVACVSSPGLWYWSRCSRGFPCSRGSSSSERCRAYQAAGCLRNSATTERKRTGWTTDRWIQKSIQYKQVQECIFMCAILFQVLYSYCILNHQLVWTQPQNTCSPHTYILASYCINSWASDSASEKITPTRWIQTRCTPPRLQEHSMCTSGPGLFFMVWSLSFRQTKGKSWCCSSLGKTFSLCSMAAPL